MERSDRPVSLSDAALTDATEILERAAADEAAADVARALYRIAAMPALPLEAPIAPLLVPGEHVVAVRHAARLDRRQPPPGVRGLAGLAGELYLTSRRLVLVGRLILAFELDTIEEIELSAERLLLVLRDGEGVTLEVTQPRLLRVEIAAARAAMRA